MGWTSYYKADTSLKGRKEECDKILNENKVLKSTMVGSTYYAAVELKDKRVIAAVILTRVDNKDYYNFSYKLMDESMGPNESKCPQSILDMLSRPENEWSENWRIRCENYNSKKRELANMPFGGKVIVNGNEYEKSKWGGRKKWIDWKNWAWLSESRIAEVGYEIRG